MVAVAVRAVVQAVAGGIQTPVIHGRLAETGAVETGRVAELVSIKTATLAAGTSAYGAVKISRRSLNTGIPSLR